jgi:predicted RNase H-like HicB family nuclease
MAQPMTYVVRLERDERGWWVATVADIAGCRTQGRSIEQALGRVRHALDACGEDDGADLAPDFVLPPEAHTAVAAHAQARKRLEREQESARAATERAVATLVDSLGMSVRDAGALLGLSHQRIHQLIRGASLAGE